MKFEFSSMLLVSLVFLGMGIVSADSAYPLNWDGATVNQSGNESYPPNDAATAGSSDEVPAMPVIGLAVLGGSLAGLVVRKMRK